MSTILKRVLTRMSIIDFGRHNGKTVQQLMDEHQKPFLLWCYYNCSKIDFNMDIKKEILILKHGEIAKPGVDREKWNKILKILDKALTYFRKPTTSKRRTAKSMRKNAPFRRYYTKGFMQAKNHGNGNIIKMI